MAMHPRESFTLKTLSPTALPAALEKAQRYRLLNEAHEAESICLDILAIAPDHQAALVTLLLALTDQFGQRLHPAFTEAKGLLPKLRDEYSRAYYEGIVYERRAKAHHRAGDPSSGIIAFGWLSRAMTCFEEAETLRPANDDDALLRWNTCARMIMSNPNIKPPADDTGEHFLE